MALASLLVRTRSIASAARLLAAAGVTGRLTSLAPIALADPEVREAARLETGGLDWLIIKGDRSEAPARRAARRAMRRGDTVGVLAVGSHSLTLTVAIDHAPLRTTLISRPSQDDLSLLARLAECSAPSPLEAALRLAALLALEPAGRRFVRCFRDVHAQLVEATPAGPGPMERDALALLQLTRVLFLYFVQSKGWLDGKTDYLARGVDSCLGSRRHVHRDFLHPLFFGTLNRRIATRGRGARRLGSLPYLNGGLFERHPLERRWRALFPNEVWRRAFDDLFERFDFCTREGAGDSHIAPDMLGRVFEGIMDPDARARSGSYYTPPALVELLLDHGLSAVVESALGVSHAESMARLGEPDPYLRKRLRRLTVLDPAAGSGAFLLAALLRLAHLTRDAQESVVDARRRTLCDSIFGVDLNPVAIRLAELRLWLAVIAEDGEVDPTQVRPLPNLDSLLRQGDSLRSTVGGLVTGTDCGERLRCARTALFLASGADKPAAIRQLRAAERSAALSAIAGAESALEHKVRETLTALRSPDLFGEHNRSNSTSQHALARAREQLKGVRFDRRRLTLHDELPAFDYAVQFSDVLETGGFDLVIGNPPWVRGEALSQRARARLVQRYRWFRGVGPGWRHPPDLSVAFLERSLEVARPGGAVAMLVPAKLCAASYASHARHGLATEAALHVVAEVPNDKSMQFEATTYPLAVVATKGRPSAVQEVRVSLESPERRVRQQQLQSGAPWILRATDSAAMLTALGNSHPSLSSLVRIQLGVKTGADGCFVTDVPDLEAALMRRAVRGRDIQPFRVQSHRWLRWPCDERGHPLPSLPPLAAAHFKGCAGALRARRDYQGGPLWSLFRTKAATAPHRTVWADMGRCLRAVALVESDDRALIPLNTCYVVALPNELAAQALTAWLNSAFARLALEHQALPAANGYRRYTATTVGRLPLPTEVLRDASLADLARAARGGHDIAYELNDRVHALLGLGGREAAVLAAAGSTDHSG